MSSIIKVSARIGNMVELVKIVDGIKIHCANFKRNEIKIDKYGIVLVKQEAHKRNIHFFAAAK
jgi:hypothetical protein